MTAAETGNTGPEVPVATAAEAPPEPVGALRVDGSQRESQNSVLAQQPHGGLRRVSREGCVANTSGKNQNTLVVAQYYYNGTA